jgi:iron complex transport system substrate-binding protein
MAPSITETLYALGLGDRVVGVTRDCHFPPEVNDKVRVGGYYDPNLEAIVSLKPDLVVLLEEEAQSLPGLAKLNVETLAVCHKTIEGIIESFRTIGRVCGKGAEGRRMECEFRERMDRIRARTRGLPRPRVLFVLDRTHGCGHLADLYVAADDDYLDTIVQWAGGQNAYRQRGVRYPVVSTEGILRLNPQVIVDLTPAEMVRQFGRQAILDDWKELATVNAVKNNRILIFDQDYAYVPGPRFLKLVEDLASAIHPEVRD